MVEDLLHRIIKFDCHSGVFSASVTANDYRSGFRATLEFRAHNTGLFADGDTPEEALQNLYTALERYGRCPTCGGHKDPERKAAK